MTEAEADRAGYDARYADLPRTANPHTEAARGYAWNVAREVHRKRWQAWNRGWLRADAEKKGWVMSEHEAGG